ncbi:hypothetical protein N9933_01135 [bacterium]|nr:hypothetical protein [bacterium]
MSIILADNTAPDTVDQDSGIQLAQGKFTDTTPLAAGLGGFDIVENADELERLGVGYSTWGDDQTYRLALAQPFSEQLGNMFKGAVPNAKAGLIMNFNYDLPDMKDMMVGKEKEYGSWVSKIADELRDEVADFPIYREGSNFSDPSYWMYQMQNVAFSGGLMAGMLAEQAALSSITTATLGAGGVAQLAKIAGSKRKLQLLGASLFGSWKGVHEGYINGLETYENAMLEAERLGVKSHDERVKYASDAAAMGYRMEVGPLMLLNALQFATIGKYNPFKRTGASVNSGASGGIESIGDFLFKGVKNKYAKGALNLGTQVVSEGFEEGFQTGVSKTAQHEAFQKADLIFSDLDLWDQEMTDSIVGGMLGGAMFSGGGKAIQHLRGMGAAKKNKKAQEAFLATVGKRAQSDLKQLSEIMEKGTQQDVDTMRYKMQKSNVFEALELDFLNGNEAAYESYVGSLQEVLSEAQQGDIEALKKRGVDTNEDIQFVQNNYPEFIQDAIEIREKLVKNLQKIQDYSIAADVTEYEHTFDKALEFIERGKNELTSFKANDKKYKALSPEGKELVDLQARSTALLQNIAILEGKDNDEINYTETVSEEEKKEVLFLRDRIAELKGKIKKEDKAIISVMDTSEMTRIEDDKIQYQKVLELSKEAIKKYSDPRYQREKKELNIRRDLKRARTPEDFEKIKTKLRDAGLLTPEINSKIDIKRDGIEVIESSKKPESPQVEEDRHKRNVESVEAGKTEESEKARLAKEKKQADFEAKEQAKLKETLGKSSKENSATTEQEPTVTPESGAKTEEIAPDKQKEPEVTEKVNTEIDKLEAEKQVLLKPLIEEKEQIEKEIDKLEEKSPKFEDRPNKDLELSSITEFAKMFYLTEGIEEGKKGKKQLKNIIKRVFEDFIKEGYEIIMPEQSLEHYEKIGINKKGTKRIIKPAVFYKGQLIQEGRYTIDATTLESNTSKNSEQEESNLIESFKEINSKIELNREYSLKEVSNLLSELPISKSTLKVFNLIKNLLSKLDLKVSFNNEIQRANGTFQLYGGIIRINLYSIFSNPNIKTADEVSNVIVHELIHGVTEYLHEGYKKRKQLQDPHIVAAFDELYRLFDIFKQDKSLAQEYGLTDVGELLSELSNPDFVEKLKNKKLDNNKTFLDKIYDTIISLFGIKKNESGYTAVYNILNTLVSNPNIKIANIYYNNTNIKTAGKVESKLTLEDALERRTKSTGEILQTEFDRLLELSKEFGLNASFTKGKNEGTKLSQLKQRLNELNKEIDKINAKYNAKIEAVKQEKGNPTEADIEKSRQEDANIIGTTANKKKRLLENKNLLLQVNPKQTKGIHANYKYDSNRDANVKDGYVLHTAQVERFEIANDGSPITSYRFKTIKEATAFVNAKYEAELAELKKKPEDSGKAEPKPKPKSKFRRPPKQGVLFDPNPERFREDYNKILNYFKSVEGNLDPTMKELEALLIKLELPKNQIETYKNLHKNSESKQRFEELKERLTETTRQYDSPENIEEDNSKIIEDILEDEKKTVGIKETGEPRKVNSKKLAKSDPASAALSELYEILSNGSKKGLGRLARSKHINSSIHLDPTQLNAGDKLYIQLAPNPNSIPVMEWRNNKGERRGEVPFGSWALDVKEGSQEWIEKVPMIAYVISKDGQKGDGAFFIHDTEWYNPSNIADEDQEAIIKEARERIIKIRQSVIDNGTVEVEVTSKSLGHATILSGKLPTLSENISREDQITIGYADVMGNLIVDGDHFYHPKNKRVRRIGRDTNTRHQVGTVYEVRRTSKKGEYVSLKTINPQVSKKSIVTMVQAVKAFYTDDKTTINSVSKHRKVSLTSAKGLNDFLNLFMKPTSTTFLKGQKDTLVIIKLVEKRWQHLPINSPFWFTQNGTLYFGRVSSGKTSTVYHINAGNVEKMLPDFEGFLSSGEDSVVLKKDKNGKVVKDKNGKAIEVSKTTKIRQNTSGANLKFDTQVPHINEQGQIEEPIDYKTHLVNTLQTTVKAWNNGTQENPDYVTFLQPTIFFQPTGEVVKEKEEEYFPEDTADPVSPEDNGLSEAQTEAIEILQKLYPEIKIGFTQDGKSFEVGDDKVIFNQEKLNEVQYILKSVRILSSEQAKQMFAKGKKNGWNLDMILTKLQVPKEQKQIVLTSDFGGFYVDELSLRENIIISLMANNSFVIEVNTATSSETHAHRMQDSGFDIYQIDGKYYVYDPDEDSTTEVSEEAYTNWLRDTAPLETSIPTEHYPTLSAPGGTKGKNKYKDNPDWEYRELAIQTPDIINNNSKHANEFANGVSNMLGWVRVWYNKKTGVVEVQEVQSALFQEGRDKKDLVTVKDRLNNNDGTFLSQYDEGIFILNGEQYRFHPEADAPSKGDPDIHVSEHATITIDEYNKAIDEYNKASGEYKNKITPEKNQFLQLLNKKGNWVNFFIQSIVQDSIKKGYNKVLFPSGNTASKIEGHTTLEEYKKSKEDRIKYLENNPTIIADGEYINETTSFNFNGVTYDQGSILTIKNGEAILKNGSRTKKLYNVQVSEFFEETGIQPEKVIDTNKISELKKELERVEGPEGFGALKPIYNFYENRVTNTLNKLYNVNQITDEHSSTWNEVAISPEMKDEILLQKTKDGEIAGQANIDAMTVLFDKTKASDDTIYHEYAHHYIAWNRDSPLVQEAIKQWGSEENLVQAIGEQSVAQKGKAWEWFKKFMAWLKSDINKLSDKSKEELRDILTDAFLTRADLSTLNETKSTEKSKQNKENKQDKETGVITTPSPQDEDNDSVPLGRLFTQEEIHELVKLTFEIPELSGREQAKLISYLFNVYSRETFKKRGQANKEEVFDKYKNQYLTHLNNSISALNGQEMLHESLQDKAKIKELSADIVKLQATVDNFEYLDQKATELLSKYTNVEVIENSFFDYENQNTQQTNWSKSSNLEDNGKKYGSYLLKRFYAGVYARTPGKLDKDGKQIGNKVVRDKFGTPSFIGFDVIDDTIKSILTSPVEIETDIDLMLEELRQHTDIHPWLSSVISDLMSNETSEQLRNTFVVENHRHNLSMIFIMFAKTRTGRYTLRNYYTNANAVERVIRKQWQTNLTMNRDLVYYNKDSGGFDINLKHANSILRALAKRANVKYNKKNIKQTLEDIADAAREGVIEDEYLLKFLDQFGIDISQGTLEELRSKGVYVKMNTNDTEDTHVSYWDMFTPSKSSWGIFGKLLHELGEYSKIDGETIPLGDSHQNSPLQDANGILKRLSKTEGRHSFYTAVTSFRDGKKGIYGKPFGKFITDTTRRLKQDKSSFREDLLNDAFSENSLYAQLLDESNKFRSIFSMSHLGIIAFKQQNKPVFGDNNGITMISDGDHDLTKLGLLGDQKLGEYEVKLPGTNFSDTRIGRLLFPTFADKDQAIPLQTVVLNIKKEHILDEGGVNDEILNILYSQMAEPELKRIFHFFDRGGNTTINGYDDIASMFAHLPSLNNVVVNGRTMAEHFNTDKDGENGLVKPEFIEHIRRLKADDNFSIAFKEGAKAKIQDFLIAETAKKEVEWWGRYKKVDKRTGNPYIAFIGSDYLQSKGSIGEPKEQLRTVAYDFIVNYAIGNANMNMMYTGDLAFYKKGKLSNYFEHGDLSKPLYGKDTYAKYMKEQVDTNFGKRMAAQIAPRKKMNGSLKGTYHQVFLDDYITFSENIIDLSWILDGQSMTKEEYDLIGIGNKLEIGQLVTEAEKNNYENNKKALTRKFPRSSSYFSMEGSDAQEYTTIEEHLNILMASGYLEDSVYETVQEQLHTQREWMKKNPGEKIPREFHISSQNLRLIFQPMKPVYSGFFKDLINDVMRMVYIKSASFPLLPQITAGFEIDKLRILLEEFETKHGKSVRASYQSGNKVGGSKNVIRPFRSDNTFDNSITVESIETSSIELSRDNFGIQQDAPIKFTKEKESRIAMVTQVNKLLFGDGMMDMEDFMYQSPTDTRTRPYTGKELHEEFRTTWVKYIGKRRESLLEEFGVDENFKPIDPIVSLSKIQNILRKEAMERGYTQQNIEALVLIAEVVVSYDNKFEFAQLNSEQISFLQDFHVREDHSEEDIEKYEKIFGNTFKWESVKDSDIDFEFSDLNFSIPLWLSPDSNRFESLLNSIINKRLIDIKLPGESYVIASEAGFKIDTELGGLDQSRIVFTDKFDREYGGLKAAKSVNGVLQKNQVFVRSSFREVVFIDGKKKSRYIQLINEDGTTNEKYTEYDEYGVMVLKEGVIEKILLDNPAFRIPVSAHLSMGQLEIAGFLPPEAGDVMIVPANLVIQKGLDFDFDKEFLYQPHTFTTKEGKIGILDEKEKNRILKRVRETSPGKEEADLIDHLFATLKGESVFYANNPAIEEKVERLEKELEMRVLENAIIRIHSSVLSNPNDKVQEKINNVLSLAYLREQAAKIQEKTLEKEDLSNWSMFSNTHQRYKMRLGAVGKTIGIGVYSNYVTMHSLFQQSPMPITLQMMRNKKLVDFEMVLGNFHLKGELGRAEALKPVNIATSAWDKMKVTISSMFGEKQNTATDNDKEQIMGRVNVNEVTINVDALLTEMGAINDSLYGEPSKYSYLFLSQPIIKRYVEMIRDGNSNTEDFIKDRKKKIVNELLGTTNPKTLRKLRDAGRNLTPEYLYENLSNTKIDSFEQKAVLRAFVELEGQAERVSTLIRNLNINSTGLGKSQFDVLEKKKFIERPYDLAIKNSEFLIGDIIELDSENDPESAFEMVMEDAYIAVDETDLNGVRKVRAIKPRTPEGAMLIYGVEAGYKMWADYFPYDSEIFEGVFDQILEDISSENQSAQKSIELSQLVFQEYKKFISSSQALGLIDGDPQSRRRWLGQDAVGFDSLATYLRENIPKHTVLKENPLLSSFLFDGISPNSYSIIKFNNSKNEDFDEELNYSSIVSLFEDNVRLPDYNGQPFSTNILAEYLLEYAYLEGGIQKAIQFVKYVPVSVLNKTSFGPVMREWHRRMKDPRQDTPDKNGVTLESLSQNFIRQFPQHNPQILTKVPLEMDRSGNWKDSMEEYFSYFDFREETYGNDLSSLMLFKLKNEFDDHRQYMSIYNPVTEKGFKKYVTFQRTSDGHYQQISTLGVLGMDEYSILMENVASNVNRGWNYPYEEHIQGKNENGPDQNDFWGIKEKQSVDNIVSNILQGEFTKFGDIQTILKALSDAGAIPNDLTVVVEKDLDSLGEYRYMTRTIALDESLFEMGKEEVAKTFVKELVHRLTYHEMVNWIDKNGNPTTNKTAPAYIASVQTLYKEFVRQVEKEYGKDAIQRVKDFGPTSEEDKKMIFPATDIFEFVEVMFTEIDTQEKFNKTPYKNSGKSIVQKFKEIVIRLFNSLTEGSLSFDTINTIFEIIEADVNPPKPNQIEDNIQKGLTILNKMRLILPPESNNLSQNKKTIEEDLNEICK